jgi:hypothetical protein
VGMTTDVTLQVSGEAHYLRFEVMAILEQSRGLTSFNTPATDVTAQIVKIDACIATITSHRAEHEHSLWDILLDELNACKRTLQNRNVYDAATPHLMTQHAGYLGRMRGLPAALSQVPSNPMTGVFSSGEGCGDPDDITTTIPVMRTFSNYAQRQISSQLSATVSGGAVRQNASGGQVRTQDPCMSGGPVLRWSPALRPMNNILPIPELATLPESLPLPSGPLLRQVARSVSSSTGTD